jgi:hypothetical protein
MSLIGYRFNQSRRILVRKPLTTDSLQYTILSRDWVTLDGVWIGDSIYWPLTLDFHNCNSFTATHTVQITVTAAHIFLHVFSSRLLVTALNTGLRLRPYNTAHIPKSKSKLLYDWQLTVNQILFAAIPLRFTIRILFFRLNHCDHSPYVTPALTRRKWVCLL